MKKLFVLFFIITTNAFSQENHWEKMNWMIDLKLGMTINQADSIIKLRGGEIWEDSTKTNLHAYRIRHYHYFPVYAFITFKKASVNEIQTRIELIRATEKIVSFKPRFVKIKAALRKKYGKPKVDNSELITWYFGKKKRYSATLTLVHYTAFVTFSDRKKNNL